MPDAREQLGLRFANNRYANFGNIITKMVVRGIRCHSTTVINVRNPITAISGYNGTGKSTLLQLAAAAYRHDERHFSVADFIIRGTLDAMPFRDDASVEFTFETQQGNDGRLVSPGSVTLSYNPNESRWDGYERRPVRNVFFGGIGMFLPRSERQEDYFFQNPDRLRVEGTVELSDVVRDWSAKILNCGYESVSENKLKYRTRREEVLSTVSNGNSYSESHMGCGEGRVQCMLAQLESLPRNSLILLEEPETSLHPNAEYELGNYLIDLCGRNGHQILITTHSDMLLRSLPQTSLIHLLRRQDRIDALSGITSSQASSLMADGYNKALTILVEDIAAEIVLTELLRHFDAAFLRTVGFAIAGDLDDRGRPRAGGKDAMRNAMISLSQAGLKIAAVLDGGEAPDPEHYVYKLPGNHPPEEALFQCQAVRDSLRQYETLDVNALVGELRDVNCHDYFKVIGHKVDCEETFLIREAARIYAPLADRNEVMVFIEQLKDAANRRMERRQ